MKKWLLLAFLGVGVCFLVVDWSWRPPASTRALATGVASAPTASDGPRLLPGLAKQGLASWDSAFESRFPVHGKVRTRRVGADILLSEDSRRVALSSGELGWMQKHYYPTDEALASLPTRVSGDVDPIADPYAGMLQGLALLDRPDPSEGIVLLRKAALRGALYGYEEAAVAEHRWRIRNEGHSDDADDVLRAHLEVAQILGDYKVDGLLSKHLPDYFWKGDPRTYATEPYADRIAGMRRNEARALAMQRYVSQFLRELGLQAQSLGVVAPGPDPRPGARQWEDLQQLVKAGESATVDVYTSE